MTAAHLTEVELPDFGTPEAVPEIPPSLYADRLARLRSRADRAGYDVLIVYADREHSANLSYLTGFDPRFEEAMLIVGGEAEPAILVGNECYGTAGAAPLPMRRHLFQDFSLPSQPRDRSRALSELLRDEGIRETSAVGVIGWKEFDDRSRIEIPAYIVDELRTLTPSGSLENAGHLLTGAADGLRVINEVEQLAAFEYAACRTSDGVRRLIRGLEPGLREDDAVALLKWNGMPLSCHLMLTSGERAAFGLLSPGVGMLCGLPPAFGAPGRVGLISRSGTLSIAMLRTLTRAGIGQSTAVSIGGDSVIGRRPVEYARLFDADPETDAIVVVGEIGGGKEAELARAMPEFSKPVVAMIVGRSAPEGRQLGHAGMRRLG